MQHSPPPLRTTTTPLRTARPASRRLPVLLVLAVVAAFSVSAWLGFNAADGGAPNLAASKVCAAHACQDVQVDVRAAAGGGARIECAYCNQDPNRWRALTSTPPPELGGKSAAVIEGACGSLLYGFNENERRPPASLTKIVAAMVAVDRAKLTDVVEVRINGWELSAEDNSTIMGLETGMRLPVRDLLYGMLLASGNDAALALADHLGDTTKFVNLMNAKVRDLGLANTNFVTPDGRDAPGHYSSAFDMAFLGRALLQNPTLKTIVNTRSYQPHWDGPEIKNNNEMIYAYSDAIGIKTGYTETADFTIVTAMEREGRLLVVSTFGGWHLYLDAVNLLNWAFANTRSACP